MNRIFNILALIIKYCLNNPLSLLRIGLSVLIGKKLLDALEAIYLIPANYNYTLSNTWFLNLLPDSFFLFDTSQFILLKSLIIISTIGATLGVLGRINLFIISFLSFYILGVIEGIGVFDHHLSLPSQVIFALALVPGSMKLSIDYIALKFYYNWKKLTFKQSENPKWGFNLILILVVLTYFTAGISKLRYGNGINWLDGSTLGFYLQERSLQYEKGDMQLIIGDNKILEQEKWKDKFGFLAHTYGNYQTLPRWNEIANYIANNKALVIGLSIGSVLFELLGFIVFINSKYRNTYLISAILFHLSIGQLMGISFRQYRLICFCLIDWNLIINSIKKSKGTKFLKIKFNV